ncbi:MAG: amino acid ABC transporter permease [Clostridia bacterium]
MAIKWDLFVQQFVEFGGYKIVLEGLQNTLIIAVLGLLIGILLGTILAITKVVPKYKLAPKIFSKLTDIYVGFFRGTPIVVQLLLVYFVLLPAMKVQIPAVYVAVIVFGMNSGAYACEIMRSGLQSVDGGQLEAGRSLGMSYIQTMLKIVIPQAVKNIFPTLGNEFISLVKETSVVSFITVVDLTKAFKGLASANYEYIIPYCILALFYLVIVIFITIIIRAAERRMAKSERNK